MERNKSFRYSTTFYRHRKQQQNKKSRNESEEDSSEMVITEDELTTSVLGQDNRDSPQSSELSCEPYSEPDSFNLSDSEISENNSEPETQDVVQPNTVHMMGLQIRKFLPLWAIKNNISQVPLAELLTGLTDAGIPGLPKDPRTLLKTPKTVNIKNMGLGKYWYNGIENCLEFVPKYIPISKTFTVKLDFGIDGLPLHESSSKQLWPICLKVSNIPDYPCQIVAIYYGTSKPPSASEYLQDLCEDLLNLMQNGLQIDDIKLTVETNAFICDTPARCFIACVVQYNAYYGCLKCSVKGKYFINEKRMSYAQINCPLRTDMTFREKTDPHHHQKKADGECIPSPLESLPVDMVQDIIIADSLHLIDRGIMKTNLKLWMTGSRNLNFKLFKNHQKEISQWLSQNDKYRPSEIHRSTKDLDISNWKATQFHYFLFYRGIIILKNHLPNEVYNHFLLFFCGVFLCYSSHFKDHLDLAEEMLKDYIEGYISIYGEDSITSNIHNICHIIEDVKSFGPLPKISTYTFENKLGTIKKPLRNWHRPLAQVVKRLAEHKINMTDHVLKPNTFALKKLMKSMTKNLQGYQNATKK